MSIDCIADRFAKLRAMREKLCKSENSWQEAFQARDWMLGQLRDVQSMICDESITRDQIENKVSDIICILDPAGKDSHDD